MKSIRRRDIWAPPVPTRENTVRVFLPGESPFNDTQQPKENVYPGVDASSQKLFEFWHIEACHHAKGAERISYCLKQADFYMERIMKEIEGL